MLEIGISCVSEVFWIWKYFSSECFLKICRSNDDVMLCILIIFSDIAWVSEWIRSTYTPFIDQSLIIRGGKISSLALLWIRKSWVRLPKNCLGRAREEVRGRLLEKWHSCCKEDEEIAREKEQMKEERKQSLPKEKDWT